MFARKVSMHLKAECAGEFIKKMETEVIPLLRRQKGFLDEITLFSQSGKEVYTCIVSGKLALTPREI